MRHAILILAHENLLDLKGLVEYFSTNCDIYIHIDKKTKCRKDILESILRMKGVRYISQKYKTNWGDYNILLAELHLLQVAYADQRATYYHLFSGLDYPLRPLQYFLDFFERNNGMNYIHCRIVESRHVYDRLLQYYPFFLINAKTEKGKWIVDKLVDVQRKLGIARTMQNCPRIIAVGSQWFSITDSAVSLILHPTMENKKFLKRLKYTFAPEELYINTVVINGIIGKKIQCDNLRYIRWKYENGNCPSNLDLSHLKYCMCKHALFARKFDTVHSRQLKSFIDENIINRNYALPNNKEIRWQFDRFYEYNSEVVKAVNRVAKCLNIQDIIYIECGNCLYLDSFIGLKLPIQGVSSNEMSDKYASVYNLQEYYQHIDITEDVDIEDTFEMLLIINGSNSTNIYESEIAMNNLCNLAGKYMLIIEDKETLRDIDRLNCFVGKILSSGFHINCLSNAILPEYSMHSKLVFFMEKNGRFIQSTNEKTY